MQNATAWVPYEGKVTSPHKFDNRWRDGRLSDERLSDDRWSWVLVERSKDLIVRYDNTGIVHFVSPSASDFGLSAADLVGRDIGELIEPGALEPGELSIVHRRLAGGRRCTDEGNIVFRLRRGDSIATWVEASPLVIRDHRRRVTGVVATIRDITERRLMQAELDRLTQEAAAAATAKTEFLANMSHEIRTPLTGVVGYASLLRRLQGLPDRAHTYVQRIEQGAEALRAIVDNVFDFSQLKLGAVELQVQPFEPRALLAENLQALRPHAEQKGLSLDLDLAPLPPAMLGDARRLSQVLLNLLGNAIKFTQTGSVCLAARMLPGPGGNLRVEVRDTGPGIPASAHDRIFQRFQVDGSCTREHSGCGLGLAICKGLVELMGGAIGFETLAGQGSTFWFELPMAEQAACAANGPATVEDEPTPAVQILLVDDLAVNRELVTAILEPLGASIVEAENGLEAVAACNRQAFDLILMDLQMPKMDGLEATRIIRAGSVMNGATPILALSANVLATHVEACRQAGFDDHIGKPINLEELLSKVAAWSARP